MTLTPKSSPFHGNVVRWDLDYPAGTRFAEDIDPEAGASRVPTARYTDPEILRREIDRIWLRTWQMACREDELDGPGAFTVYEVADQQYLIVRQRDGSLRAFANVCRHRGNLLRQGSGRAESLQCRYHQWCWEIDGSLRSIPDRHLFSDLASEDLDLSQVPCGTWAGFVFLNPDPEATRSLDDHLGPVADQLAPYRLEEMVTVRNVTQPLSCNWKTAVEGFLETYHTQGLHPQLLSVVDDVNTTYEVCGDHSRMILPMGVPSMRVGDAAPERVLAEFADPALTVVGAKLDLADLCGDDYLTVRQGLIEHIRQSAVDLGHDYSDLSDGQYIDDWHYLLFPGLILNVTATSVLGLRVRPDGSNPDRCLFDVLVYYRPGGDERLSATSVPNTRVDEGAMSHGLVLEQDFRNLVGVQKGLHQRSLDHLILSRQEIRVIAFEAAVTRYLEGSA